ncbi:MAG TPA: alpha-L-arabinofuranosidase, partial [Flavisolibacter sp.]
MKKTIAFLLLMNLTTHLWSQPNPVFTVKPNSIKGTVQPTMWGIFFEDINFAADGGVYAELVKNRSFEFASPMMGWRELKKEGGSGNILVINRVNSSQNNPRFIRA